MSVSRGREWTFAVALAAAAAALLCTTFVFGSTPDEEEFRFAVLSAFLRIQALAAGHLGLWTSLLGLGVPQPFVPTFGMHPLAPLLAWLSPATWVRVLLVAHTLAGTIGMWRLGAVLGMNPAVRGTGVGTFLLAAPAQNYVLSDFWPSHYIVWTLAPWLLLMAWHVLSPDVTGVRRASCLLGVTAGVAAGNANPAYLLVFAPLAAAVLLARPKHLRARWPWMAVSAALALVIAAPTFAQLAAERRYFAPELGLSNVTDPLPLRSAMANAFAPFTTQAIDSRSVFFGAPYAVLAVVGCIRLVRRRIDLALSAAIYAMFVFTAWIPMPWMSQRYQFRDPLILCAILLAGLALSDVSRRPRFRVLTAVLLGIQVASIAYVAWPAVARMWDAEGRRGTAYRGATAATPLADRLVALLREPGRLAYSPQVDYDVSERALVVDGLGLNALAYRGVSVINGSFKSASTDPISPDDRLFYGRIRTPAPLTLSDAALDVLGIRYVLARHGERVADGLRERATFPTARVGQLVLFENPDAWPGAFLVPPAFGDRDLPRLPGCAHHRLLCRDLSSLAAHRGITPVAVSRDNSNIRVRWKPAGEPRILVVTEMFRPEWRAQADGRPVATRQMYGGLIGVPLPPGIEEVQLRYQPRALLVANLVAYVALAGGIIGCFGISFGGRRRRLLVTSKSASQHRTHE